MAIISLELANMDVYEPKAQTLVQFVKAADALLKYAEARLWRAGLSVIKFRVLSALAANGGVMKPCEIARWTMKEQHNITTLIERMKRDGLVTARHCRGDRRSMQIRITDKGLEALARAFPVAGEVLDQVASNIAAEDMVLLEKLLQVLRHNACYGLQLAAASSKPYDAGGNGHFSFRGSTV